jgi:hypothetical protein
VTKLSQKLDAVSKAKQAYVLAKTTLEARLREQMRSELANLQTQIDIAVRYAVDAGESKAAILRALGTKDYNTVKASLERTQGVAEVVGADPFAGIYRVEDNILYVNWDNHGTEKYNGVASFNITKLEDGTLMFFGRERLWNDDYTVRNDAIALLDGQNDGKYYDEVVAWLGDR